jgi:hypothetical protein
MNAENQQLPHLDAVLAELRQIKRSNEAIEQHIRAINQRLDRTSRRTMDSFLRQLLKEPRYSDPRRLEHYAYKVFSENGEDGTLQEVFRRIGTTNKCFVEFGVSGGNQNNTHYLLYLGWSGLWLEANEACVRSIEKILGTAIAANALALQHVFVTAENINDVIASAGISGEIDLLSVDIDGNDWHVTKAIQTIIPRVIVTEYNGSFPRQSSGLCRTTTLPPAVCALAPRFPQCKRCCRRKAMSLSGRISLA